MPYAIADASTGWPVSVKLFPTVAAANKEIGKWEARNPRAGRLVAQRTK